MRSTRSIAPLFLLGCGCAMGCAEGATGSADAATADARLSDASPPDDATTTTTDARELDAGPDAPPAPTSDFLYVWGDYTVADAFTVGRVNLGTRVREELAPIGFAQSVDIDRVALSPDGTRLAIAGVSSVDGLRHVDVFDADGSGPATTLFTFSAAEGIRNFDDLAFSPDGALVGWVGSFETTAPFGGGTEAVYVAPADGSSPAERVSQDVAAASNDVWTFVWTDATHVAFTADMETSGINSIWGVDVTTPRVATELVPAAATLTSTADVNPTPIEVDATGRVYFVGSYEGSRRLYRASADGTDYEEVPAAVMFRGRGPDRAEVTTFGTSPDGAHLAFSVDAANDLLEEVFVTATAGAEDATQVSAVGALNAAFTQGPFDALPIRWSPDGSRIAFFADYAIAAGPVANGQFALYVLPAEAPAGGVRVLPNPNTFATSFPGVAWSPDSTEVFGAAGLLDTDHPEVFATSALDTADQALAEHRLVPAAGEIVGLFAAHLGTIP